MPELTVVKSWPLPQFDPTPDEARTLAEIRTRESSGDYSARNPKPGSTASGAYQFTSSTVSPTWQLATKATGAPVYSSAAEAPQAIQDANALHMLRQYGPNATITWAASGPYRQPRNQGGTVTVAQAPAGQPASDDVLSRIATGDVTPDELAQYLQPQQPPPAAAAETPKAAPAAPLTVVKSWPLPPSAPPPPTTLDEAQRLGSIVAGSSGVTAVKDILAGGTKAAMDFLVGNPVNPQDVQQFKNAAGGILGGIAGESERMRQELVKSGDAMTRGDINEAADHLWFSLPFAGAAGATMAEYLKRGDIKGAFAHAFGSLIPFAAEPAVTATKGVIKAAPEAAATTGAVTKAAVKAGGRDVAVGAGKTALGAALAKAGPLGEIGDVLAGVPIVKSGLKQMGRGVKAGYSAGRQALAERAAATPAAAAPVVEVPPLQLGPGPVITSAPPDASFVRSVPGQYATPEPLPPSRQLPAGPNTLVTPLPEDTSFVRAVPAQYPEVEPGFQPPAAAPPPTPALSFDDLARSLTGGKSPSKLTAAERANVQNVYDRITKGLSPEEQPPPATPPAPQAAPAAPEAPAATQEPSVAPIAPEAPQTLQPAAAVEKLTDYVLEKKVPPQQLETTTPEYWKMYADDAGTTVPTKDEIAQIKANVAAQEVPQGEQTFQEQKARGEETMTPPKKNPPAAAPPAAPGGVMKQPLPEGIPAHYQEMYKWADETAVTRAFLKDQRIADYLLGKGITPEQFENMPLEKQNALILEAPAKSAKGKHLPYLPKPEGETLRPVYRWAHEGIKDIADTMRWRQAQTPAVPEAAAIPTEGLENTPIAGKAAFQAEKAKPARSAQSALKSPSPSMKRAPTLDEFRAAGEREPPVKSGYVRLYRGHEVGEIPAKSLESNWWTPALEHAEQVALDATDGHRQVSYVDIPKADLEQYSAFDHPEAAKMIGPGEDPYILPQSVSATRKPLFRYRPPK